MRRVDEYLAAPKADVERLVSLALAEDLTPLGDLTSALLPADVVSSANFVARSPGVIAGTQCVDETFRQVDGSLAVDWELRDGDSVGAGGVIARVHGRLRPILTAERTALNFLSHLSGIATLTARYVEAAPGVQVWDTRKTVPGFRSLAKAAVRSGGGRNHRGSLADAVMVKDNHLSGMTIGDAVATAHDHWPNRTVIVECVTRDQMIEAIEAGADSVLLDNMSPDEVSACVEHSNQLQAGVRRRTLIEASGGITLETIGAFAATGVDLISSGSLTNAAGVLDIGLDVVV